VARDGRAGLNAPAQLDPGAPWWQSAVVYQVYPRSFADSDGDGVGDLAGICSRLDYIAALGVDAIWLSPIYRSPMADFGYDVSDHTDIDPIFGDLQAFDVLLAEAHRRGLRVLLDWVPNHTSSQHPWFIESRASRDSPKRDWYIWRDGRGDGPPNNWVSAFGGPAWTWDEQTAQWYLHLFLPEQPDLNWANPEVVDAMHGTLRFWLDRGVDGFRADVVHLIGKDEALPDQPERVAHLHIVGSHDHPRTHELLRGIRRVLDEYGGNRAIVGEVTLLSPSLLVPYYGAGDELHLVFNFALMHVPWTAEAFAAALAEADALLSAPGTWPCWVLSNHDQPRHRTRYGGSEGPARAAAIVLLTLRGTPFLYAGEELGLLDAEVPDESRVDPGGRDGSRAPIPWDATPGHGWRGPPWLPWPPEPELANAESESVDPDSILSLYRRALEARRGSPALRLGGWRLIDSPEGTLVYERAHDGDLRRVAANFVDEPVETVAAEGGWRVEVATHRSGEGRDWHGRLEASEAVILAPAGSP
jgi:alpha-glucosidase